MKTIGVLGGLGPQATMDFERRVHDAARRRITPHFNGGYPPMAVWYCRHAPFVVDGFGRPVAPLRPDPRLLDAARWLGLTCDLLVIPSNGAHLLRREIEKAAGKPVLSMVDTTLAEVARRGWRRVGVLGLGPPVVYTEPLAAAGVAVETIDGRARDALDDAIFRLMESGAGPAPTDPPHPAATAAVAELRRRGVDGVLLGCTEIPLLLGPACDDADPALLDPAALLADAAIRAAIAPE